MDLNSLTAISPIDGRYRHQTSCLSPYFSEFGLIKFRVQVEIEYFIALVNLGLPELEAVSDQEISKLREFAAGFDLEQAAKVKDIEATTNHDVKAVEYLLKDFFDHNSLGQFKEFIHFGLTSQDINNTAIPISIQMGIEKEIIPRLSYLIAELGELAIQAGDIPMLARTHGQPASPTHLGKEFLVFKKRLEVQLDHLLTIPNNGKFGGATGNFNAHYAAYPDIDWITFADKFLRDTLGLQRNHPTTQIDHYDNLGAQLDALKRINTILIDFARDCWQYISMQYFSQKVSDSEVGSSTMPHKVNPIDFENAEGNLGLANWYVGTSFVKTSNLQAATGPN